MAKSKVKSVFLFNYCRCFRILVVLILIGNVTLNAQDAPKKKSSQIKPSEIKGEYAPGEILLKFKRGVNETRAKGVYQALGANLKRRLLHRNVLLIKIPTNREVMDMLATFLKNPLVEYAEPNYRRYRTIAEPDDLYFPTQWALSQINAPEAWDETTGSSSIIIAVIDDGIDYNHEEFASTKLWINPATGKPGYDYGGTESYYEGPLWSQQYYRVPDDDVMHELGIGGHGTATAGIAAALTDNGAGIAGTAWGPRIMALKVDNGFGEMYDDAIADAITFASDNGAHVLSMSLGGPAFSSTLENACQYAWENDQVIVVSSGNDNTDISYPARFDTTIAVGATNEIDNRIYPGAPGGFWNPTQGSSYGPELDVVAPGINIDAPDWSQAGEGYSGGDYTAGFGGTSASCPFVAGGAALLLSKDMSLTNQRVRSIIRSTADDQVGEASEDTPGFDIYYGYGRLNLYNALSASTKPDLTLTGSDDIVFSNDNPSDGEIISISATIHNNGSVYNEMNPVSFASVPDNTGSGFYVDANFSVAQSFVATTDGWLAEVALAMQDQGSDSAYAEIEIQSDSGSNTPSGTAISSRETQDWPAAIDWRKIRFLDPARVEAGKKYWIVVTCPDAYTDGYLWGYNEGSVYAGGGNSGKDNTISEPVWEVESGSLDCQFRANLYIFDTIIQFYDGDPDSGGSLIGNAYLPPIPASDSDTASVEWTAVDGNHAIYARIDQANAIPESDEENNQDYNTLPVGAVLSVVVNPTSWDLESVSESSVHTTWTNMTTAGGGAFFAYNDGELSEDLDISVTGGLAWDPGTVPGREIFAIGLGQTVTQGTEPGYTNITDGGVPLTNNLPPGGMYRFDLQFQAPTATAHGGQRQTITITVTARAAP